jgi:hypothetical protein
MGGRVHQFGNQVLGVSPVTQADRKRERERQVKVKTLVHGDQGFRPF